MPYYNDLRPESDHKKKDYALIFPELQEKEQEKKRTIQNLLRLREGLSKEVPAKHADENLLVASWNIVRLGDSKQRLPESYFYIAEILSRFDLIAIQEVKTTLRHLRKLMRILGPDWAFIANDTTEGNAGNNERSAYVYNTNRVEFAGLAGEIVLWDELTQNHTMKQLKRTPYVTGFRAGWKQFSTVCVHLDPGKNDDDVDTRKQEVGFILAALKKKFGKSELWEENLIILGDFNFYEEKDDETVQLLNGEGYFEISGLKGKDTNATQREAYDRFFFRENQYFKVGSVDDQGNLEPGVVRGNGGVFNPFDYVFRTEDFQDYQPSMLSHHSNPASLVDSEAFQKYFGYPWRRNQMSDHFPIWFELVIDSADDFLQNKLADYPA